MKKSRDPIALSDHFTYWRLLRFAFPSIVMQIVSSVYIVVDGLFVSNFVGKAAFTAVNFIWPYLMLLGCVGFMFGSGGGALIAMTLGEQKPDRANRIFSMLIRTALILSLVLTVLGIAAIRPVARWMGAEGVLLEGSVLYGWILLLSMPGYILKYTFQYLFATAGKPRLGLFMALLEGIINIVLDALFVAVFHWGIAGAAAATTIAQTVGGFVPMVYFARSNGSLLRLTRAEFDGPAMGRICSNGASELLNNLSMAFVGMLYNVQLLHYIGQDGVASYGILMYVNLVFLATFMGHSVGTAPLVGYHWGARNFPELKSLLKKSLVIISVSAAAMCILSELLARPLSMLYAGYDSTLLDVTLRAFFIYSFSFLFSGFAIFGSAFFTALNNGPVSAGISFLRTVVFQVVTVLVFPLIWQTDGIWLSMVAAEFLSAAAAGCFLLSQRKRYGY